MQILASEVGWLVLFLFWSWLTKEVLLMKLVKKERMYTHPTLDKMSDISAN